MLCLSGFELYPRWLPLFICEQNLGHARASSEYAILKNSSATASEYNKFPKTSVT